MPIAKLSSNLHVYEGAGWMLDRRHGEKPTTVVVDSIYIHEL